MIANPPQLICYPPAPLNGGKLDTAPPKVGEWVWQPKVDDWRAVIHTPSRTVWNQYGQLSSFTDTDKFTAALEWLAFLQSQYAATEWLDVGMMENRHDMMRGTIIVLDLIVPDFSSGMAFWNRRSVLETIFPVLPLDVSDLLKVKGGQVRDSVYLVHQSPTIIFPQPHPFTPLALQDLLKRENAKLGRKFYEGLVAKRADSTYPMRSAPKQQTCDWIKHRFDQ